MTGPNAVQAQQTRIIIGIHGLNNKPPEDELTNGWKLAIEEGIKRNEINSADYAFKLIYWANVRNDKPMTDNDEPYLAASGDGPFNAMGRIDIEQKLRILSSKWGGRLLDKEKDLIGLGRNVEHKLGIVVEDLEQYYKDESVRLEIRSRLEAELLENEDKEITLIAHSMGSIIAYDVLRSLQKTQSPVKVKLFLTMGSPLGLPLVSAKIREEFGGTTIPINVQRWVNVSDLGDKVALDCVLADEYKSNQESPVEKVKDVFVINGYVNGQSEPNSHKSYGYLRTPEVSELLR